MLTTVKYRIYPNKEQETLIKKNIGCSRKIYNLLLHDYNNTKKLNKVSSYKNTYLYLKEADSLALANSLQNLKQAITNYYKNPKHFGLPVFKKKYKSKQSYTTNNQKGTIYIENGKIKLPKIEKPIKIKVHRIPNGVIKNVTIERTSIGTYTVAVLFESEDKPKELKLNKENTIGMDLGLTYLAITSNGVKYDNHKYFQKSQNKLKKEQRKLSRIYESNVKEKHYNEKGHLTKITYKIPLNEHKQYQKQRLKVAKIHHKIKNQRLDTLHKLSTNIIKNHDYIVLESLDIKNLIEDTDLSKYISDVGWRIFINMLKYKSVKYGKELIQIDQYFPSTQKCSNCGNISGKKSLDIREWTCSCGVTHDRDINAAINIKQQGLLQIT